MFIECPQCEKRYNVENSSKSYEIICGCGKGLTVLSWLSDLQSVTETGEVGCSVCGRQYDLSRYRNNTEIACICGNLLSLRIPDEKVSSLGRRKTDYMSKQLQTKLHGLIDTTRLIHFVRDIDKLLLLIVKVTTEMLDSEGCSVILRDMEKHDLVFHSVTGTKSSELSRFRLAEGEGVAGSAIQSLEAVIVNDVERDVRFSKRADVESGFRTRNILCIPLIVDNECIGALEIVNKKTKEDFNEEDLFLGEAVANQIAVAIHNVQLTEMALKTERLAAVGEAVTGVAHCVKNMLNGLEGGFYVLESDIEDEFGKFPKRGLEMLGRNMDRLKGLVQDMLTYSKDRKPEFNSSDLNELVKSVFELMQVKSVERSVHLEFHQDESIKMIDIDSQGIYRCVLNVVSNAIDACEKEGSKVVITTKRLESNKVLIEIQDEGSGMDEETLQSIFQPFFSNKGSKGTGLGLSVTQKIVQEHDGSIEVESEPGRGSRFAIVLPLSR